MVDIPYEVPEGDINRDGRIWAFIAYSLGLWGIVLASVFGDKNKFATFHVRQSGGLIVTFFLSMLILAPFFSITNKVVQNIVAGLMASVACLYIIFRILGCVYACAGKVRPMPLIGRFALAGPPPAAEKPQEIELRQKRTSSKIMLVFAVIMGGLIVGSVVFYTTNPKAFKTAWGIK